MAKIGDSTIIECYKCKAKVAGKVLALKDDFPDEVGVPIQILFLECILCQNVSVGYSEMIRTGEDDWEFSDPVRLWPHPKTSISWKLPNSVRDSIEDARRCLDARVYSACVVMCGRALEAVCKEHGIANWKLQKGLKELRDKGIIDGRLLDWGEALRKSRNIGAHATETKISLDDAKDLLDFTIAICDYVYVLTDKYEAFKARQVKELSSVKKK